MSTTSAMMPNIVPLDFDDLSKNWSDEQKRAYSDKVAAVQTGILIRRFRDEAGLTQSDLARRIGSTQSHISDIERGAGPQGPTVALLERIASACGMELMISVQSRSPMALEDENLFVVIVDGDTLETGFASAEAAKLPFESIAAIEGALVEGRTVLIPDFGRFQVTSRSMHWARNVTEGTAAEVQPHDEGGAVTFEAEGQFRSMLADAIKKQVEQGDG
jgi:transcriptional regulator with XRE-family HTH domain